MPPGCASLSQPISARWPEGVVLPHPGRDPHPEAGGAGEDLGARLRERLRRLLGAEERELRPIARFGEGVEPRDQQRLPGADPGATT